MEPDWDRIRAEFPALAEWTYLNTATFGQLPRRAAQAIEAHLRRRDAKACGDFLEWFDDADVIRARIACLIRCSPEDIAFVQNASSGLAILLGGIRWRPGDRIVTLRDEFPNNLYHPAHLGQLGVEVVETDWDSFYDAITPSTRLVALSTVNYTSGFRPPLAQISRFLHERGVVFYLDGTQSIGALAFDASQIQPDMLAVHGYKWLLSPTGASFIYVHPDLRQRLEPTVIGWRSHWDWRNVDHLHHGAPEFAASAEKYEGGMLSFPLLYAMGESVDLILEIGPELIEERALALAESVRRRLRQIGAQIVGDGSPYFNSPLVAARFGDRDVSRLARELKRDRVLVSARHGNLRVSTHFYNSEADVERFATRLEALLRSS